MPLSCYLLWTLLYPFYFVEKGRFFRFRLPAPLSMLGVSKQSLPRKTRMRWPSIRLIRMRNALPARHLSLFPFLHVSSIHPPVRAVAPPMEMTPGLWLARIIWSHAHLSQGHRITRLQGAPGSEWNPRSLCRLHPGEHHRPVCARLGEYHLHKI